MKTIRNLLARYGLTARHVAAVWRLDAADVAALLNDDSARPADVLAARALVERAARRRGRK